ncbi:MAG: DUF5615 family PIN-like protein [Acidimicrobiales bacterium]
MRFLIDESLSGRVARLLGVEAHDTVHLGDLGLLGAADSDVMAAAGRADRILVSADTDFGELLALGSHSGPSLILLRRAQHRPELQAALLLANLTKVADDLAEGAIVVLGHGRVRIRRLPIAFDE